MTLKQKAMILIFVQKFLSQTKKLRKPMFDLLAMDTPWGTKRRGRIFLLPTRPLTSPQTLPSNPKKSCLQPWVAQTCLLLINPLCLS